ncbi:MAG: hypothetical protein ABJB93_07655 [Gaiellales bacterium]
MTNSALRIYTTVIALICGGAVAWSIHQSSITTSWQADARSWHSLAAQAVAHDRNTSRGMHRLVARYDRLIVRTRRSEHKLLIGIAKAQQAGAAASSTTTAASYAPLAAAPVGVSAPAPVAVVAPPPPTTHTSPAP